jgi:hypothetical protein
LIGVDPQTSHGIVNGRENTHGNFLGILADKFFIDFQDTSQFPLKEASIEMGDVQVDLRFAIDTQFHFINDLKDRACRHITRDKIPVFRVPFFKEVPRLAVFVDPDTAAFATDRFGAADATPASDSLSVDPGAAVDIPYVNDGTADDMDYTASRTSLSANWGASSHASLISSYTYAIGTTPGASDTVGVTNVGTALSVTRTGLSLAEGAYYYFTVRAYPNSGPVSGPAARVTSCPRSDNPRQVRIVFSCAPPTIRRVMT